MTERPPDERPGWSGTAPVPSETEPGSLCTAPVPSDTQPGAFPPAPAAPPGPPDLAWSPPGVPASTPGQERAPGPGSRLRQLGSALLVVALLVFAFGAGAEADRQGLLPGSFTPPPPTAAGKISLLYQAWDLVEQHYVDRAAVDPTQMTYGAIQGMLASLGDTGHTDFLTAQQAAALSTELSGQFAGIGVELSLVNNRFTIQTVFDGSPAQKAGLRAGDEILQVDGKNVASETLDDLSTQIRGKPGTAVELTVLHAGASVVQHISIVRANISLPSVTWAMVPGTTIADIRYQQFATGSAAQLVTSLKAAHAAGATKLILDMRGNPGGLVNEAVDAASQFLSGGTVFIERNAQGKETPTAVKKGGVATGIPMVVLVDNGTASAAEIVAGALQDNGRAEIVGTTTFGTGTVLNTFRLSDGSEVRIGVAEWLTPKGHEIWHKGITPNVQVQLAPSATPVTPDLLKSMTAAQVTSATDAQFARALKLLGAS